MIHALTTALQVALTAAETDLECQMRLLAGTAGKYGRNLLIAAADRVLRSHLWPTLMPRRSEEMIVRHLIDDANAGELIIRLIVGQPGTLWLSLSRAGGSWIEHLREVRIQMDMALWSQIREA